MYVVCNIAYNYTYFIILYMHNAYVMKLPAMIIGYCRYVKGRYIKMQVYSVDRKLRKLLYAQVFGAILYCTK